MSDSDMQRVTTATNCHHNLAGPKLEAAWRKAACCVPDRRLPGGEAGRHSALQLRSALHSHSDLAARWPGAAAVGSVPDTSRQDVHLVILHIYPTGGTAGATS